jgi:processive 1,2-diacylglycerol beta-glucosyltransferase
MILIIDAESGKDLGTLTEAQFQVLVDLLEEEAEGDEDYYINADTVDYFEEESADPEIVAFLRKALGSREEMEIRWKKG